MAFAGEVLGKINSSRLRLKLFAGSYFDFCAATDWYHVAAHVRVVPILKKAGSQAHHVRFGGLHVLGFLYGWRRAGYRKKFHIDLFDVTEPVGTRVKASGFNGGTFLGRNNSLAAMCIPPKQ